MLKSLIFFFIIVLILTFVGFDLIFFNEEFIVAFSLIIFFYFLYTFLRKFVVKFFFFKIDHIYFSFLYLIDVNIILARKIKNLLTIFNVRYSLIIADFYMNFYSLLNINLLQLKSLLLSNFFNIFFSNLYSNLKIKIYF